MIVDAQCGVDHLWIIRDDFAYHTAQQFFSKHTKSDQDRSLHYCHNSFEVIQYVSSKYKSSNPSVLGRFVNNLVYGLNKHKQLPKVIVIVPDDDIVKHVKSSDVMMIQIGTITEWIVKEITKAIQSYKEILPMKAKRPCTWHSLWITPPTHKNFGSSSNGKREMLTECLDKISKLYNNMSVLKIIKHWDHEDQNAFLYESYRFTSEGLRKYWLGVDAAIHFWKVVIFPKLLNPHQKSQKPIAKSKKSHFKWVPQQSTM